MSNSKQSGRFVITGPGVYRSRSGLQYNVVENINNDSYPWKDAEDDSTSWTDSGRFLLTSCLRETAMDLVERVSPTLDVPPPENEEHSSSSLAQLLQSKFSGENFTQQAVEIEILRWLVDNNVRITCA